MLVQFKLHRCNLNLRHRRARCAWAGDYQRLPNVTKDYLFSVFSGVDDQSRKRAMSENVLKCPKERVNKKTRGPVAC